MPLLKLCRFGSDKPDLRNPLELVDVADLVKDVEFKVFLVQLMMRKAVLLLLECQVLR